MERDVLSMRQIMVLLVTALLAPASDLLPGLAAQTAGRGGWLVGVGAFPILLAALWAAGRVNRSGGYRALSRVPGNIINIMYMGWILLTLALVLRLSEARLAVIYREGPAFLYTVLLLAVAVWMGLGKVSAFARAGELFYLALAVVLAGILLLAAMKVEGRNLLPTMQEAAGIPIGSVTAAGFLLNAAPAAVLGKRAPAKKGNGRRVVGWAAAFCVVVILLLGAIIGCLGPKLTARLPAPYIIMVQGLSVKGAFQRTEALIASVWVLSDLTLIGLLLHSWRALAGEVHPGAWSRWSVIPAAACALGGGWLLLSGAEQVRNFCTTILPAVGFIFGLGVPLLAALLIKIRRAQ